MLTGCSDADVFEGTPDATIALASADATTTNYGVTRQMLSKYLNLAHKSAKVKSIVPVCKDGDTLAYCVNLDEGWKLISGDQRMPPVLAFSDEGCSICSMSRALPSRAFKASLTEWRQRE